MRLVLLGAPGSGKGTQARLLRERYGIPAISTGDIFRANIAQETELGRLAKSYTDSGRLVPDEVTIGMVRQRLREPDVGPGFLLDGFPRNASQAAELDSMLAALEVQLDAVVEIVVPIEDVVVRLLGRAEIEGREDDTEDVIRHRLQVYTEQTAPLTDFYSGRGQLLGVDGSGSVDEVFSGIVEALERRAA